jgi:hypothetical protein
MSNMLMPSPSSSSPLEAAIGVDAPNPEAMLAFSVWYSSQRLGRIQSMPAFDAKSFETAIKDAAR